MVQYPPLKILLVGGAGYIGSHMANLLLDNGHHVTILDNLSTGHRELVPHCDFIEGDMGDKNLLDQLFQTRSFDALMHFAAFSQVEESIKEPFKYYQNNVVKTLVLLEKLIEYRIKYFVYSSSAAIFGMPDTVPLKEDAPTNPINPYGETKLIIERMLALLDKKYGLKSVCLRYFNAAGADPTLRCGELHNPESHLIPLVLQTALGQRDCIHIYGDDYETRDGTCIRDYVHVCDLVQAHLLALQKMISTRQSEHYNLGNGNGYSVKEVVFAAEVVTNKKINVTIARRRDGDPPVLIAHSKKAISQLQWKPQYTELHTIIDHAWKWMISHANESMIENSECIT